MDKDTGITMPGTWASRRYSARASGSWSREKKITISYFSKGCCQKKTLQKATVGTCKTALSRCICFAFSKTNLQICKHANDQMYHITRQEWLYKPEISASAPRSFVSWAGLLSRRSCFPRWSQTLLHCLHHTQSKKRYTLLSPPPARVWVLV